jgi:hypothetical protein
VFLNKSQWSDLTELAIKKCLFYFYNNNIPRLGTFKDASGGNPCFLHRY